MILKDNFDTKSTDNLTMSQFFSKYGLTGSFLRPHPKPCQAHTRHTLASAPLARSYLNSSFFISFSASTSILLW